MRVYARNRSINRNRNNQAKKTSVTKRILMIAGISLLACFTIVFVYVQVKFRMLNQEIDVGAYTPSPEIEETMPAIIPVVASADSPVVQDPTQTPDDIYSNPKALNILLLGLDTRDPKKFTGGRTDSIVIITLDTVNNQIKLTSIMRDTLVEVPGHELNRINTVYGFCGPEVAMETIQNCFRVKIDYYTVVNFWAVANIIDSVGGVEVNIKSSEIKELNNNLVEINKYNTDKDSPKITKSGKQKLNGKQAVAYMRIRHVGAADFQRTERQRNILQAITKKNFSLVEILALADGLPNNMRTNIGQLEMASLASTAFGLKGAPIRQFRIPVEGSYTMGMYKEMSVLTVDFDKNANELKTFMQSEE